MKKEEGKKCIANVIEHRYGGEIGRQGGRGEEHGGVTAVGCPGWDEEEEEEVEKARSVQVRR